jgi:hypothetical protein
MRLFTPAARTLNLALAGFALGLPALSIAPAAAQAPPPGVPCEAVSVLAVWATPAAPLSVIVNGVVVGVYDGSTSVPLDGFLKPGLNTVILSYPAMPRASTDAAIKCRPPGGKSKVTIVSLRPSAEKLQAQAHVNFTRP